MSEYIPKYPSKEGDDSNKTSSELLAETLKPIYVPQDLMLAWESHLASYSRDTNVLLDQVKDSELALNTQYQALLARVQKYEQMLQDITMDSNEFTMDTDEVNFTGWNILAQASYWDYLLRKEITKLSDQIKSTEYKGGLISEVTDAVLVGLIADNTYISNVIGALSDTPLIRELDAALTSTVTSITDLQAESVRLAEKQAADAAAFADQQVEMLGQLVTSIEASKAEQLNRLAEEAAIRTQLLQELEAKTDAITADYTAVVDTLHTTVIQELTTMQDGISASVSELKTADEAIITSLDAYKVSNGQNIAALQNSVNVVTNAQESTASQVTGLVASFNTLDSGLSKAQADIIASNQVRADEDEALSQQITTINTGLGEANSRIDTVSDSVSTLDSATAIKFTQLDTRFGGVDDSIASVRQIANSAVDSSSAQATEIDTLKSKMATTEGSLATKADASALSSLDTRVGSVEGQYTSQASDITRLSNSLDTTNLNVGTAQTAAQDAMNAAGAKGKVIFGTSAPAVEDRLSQNLWIDTTDNANTPKRWNGSAWIEVTDKVATDALEAANAATNLVNTKADTSAFNSLDQKVTVIDGQVNTNTNSITSLNGKIAIVEGGLATKLDASAISNYYTKQQTDDKSAEIAAGKVEAFKASLNVGGVNMLSDSDKSGSPVILRSTATSFSTYTVPADPEYANTPITQDTQVTLTIWYLEHSEGFGTSQPFTSVTVGKNNIGDGWSARLFRHNGKITKEGKYHKCSGVVTIPAGGTLLNSGGIGIILEDNAQTTGMQLVRAQLEYGNVATAWSPSNATVNDKIDANATAIETTNAEVTRVDGRVTTESNRITSLTGRVSTVEGAVSTKADASALNSLTTRVATEEGKSTSQGSAITSLQNTVNHATTGLSTKASSAALTAVDNKVIAVDGRVTATNSNVTSLTGRVDTVEGNLTTKADVSAVNALTTRVGDVEGGITSQANQLTSLSAKLNERRMYQLYSGGLAAATGGTGWIRGFDPDSYYDIGRSYGLVVFNGDGSIQSVNSYDVFGGHTQGFIDAVAAVPTGTYVAVLTSDEPSQKKELIKPSLRSLGGSDAIDQAVYRGAYLLVGRKGLPTGQAIEKVSNTTSFGVDYLLEMYGSVPIGLGGSSPQSSIISNMRTEVSNIDGIVSSQASQILVLESDNAANKNALTVQSKVIDGVKASYMVKMESNGVIGGFGLMQSTGELGQVATTFGVNADAFFIGAPVGGKKPFMVLTSSQTIDGITYPAGTWINTAIIANATIGSAHIADASITDAHIVSLNASKITAGIIDAERIGANSISVEKLMVGDATNLWGNQHFNPNGPLLGGSRTRIVTDMSELKGNGMQLWGRDHIAPYTSKFPIKEGDTFVIEYIAGRNAGPDLGLNVGLCTYNINGNGGSAPWQFGPAEQIAYLGNGWFRWRRIFAVTNYGHTLPVAYGVLYFQIEQSESEPNPAYWSVGDVTVRKGVGGELIVNGSITADKIQVDNLSAISGNLGSIKVGTANIDDLSVTSLKIADRSITSSMSSAIPFTPNVTSTARRSASTSTTATIYGLDMLRVGSRAILFLQSDIQVGAASLEANVSGKASVDPTTTSLKIYLNDNLVITVRGNATYGGLITSVRYDADGNSSTTTIIGSYTNATVPATGTIMIPFDVITQLPYASVLRFEATGGLYQSRNADIRVSINANYLETYTVEFLK